MPTIQGRIDEDGAVIQVSVWGILGQASESGLFHTTALIDTGASRTAIHPMIVAQLDLRPRGSVLAMPPGSEAGASHEVPLYDVGINLRGIPGLLHVTAVGAAPATASVLVLIGRDILDECAFVYNRPPKRFSLIRNPPVSERPKRRK